MKNLLLILLFTAAIACAQPNPAQPMSKTSIDVAGVKLRLGMTKAQVAEKLAGQSIEKMQDDEWMIGSLKAPVRFGPTLYFTHGVLTYADREWTSSNTELADALFGVVTLLNQEGFFQCNVHADTTTSPDLTGQRVWIRCGEKTILILKRTFGKQSSTAVYEQLGSWKETAD